MPDRRALEGPKKLNDPEVVVYTYDGSFDGLMCCVFESYDKNEIPADVLPENETVPYLLPVKHIETNEGRAKRVLSSIPKKMGSKALRVIHHAFLTCHPQKDQLILKFMRLGYSCGPSIMNRLTDETVHELFTAVNHLDREAGLYMGFIRFSEANGALTAQIEPKNIVLPLIGRHFRGRYPAEQFLIYDKTHGMALLHYDRKLTICSIEAFEQPDPGEEELKFRELWRLFYDTIEIKERHNPRCRMSLMPKRYWNCMTEFAREPQSMGHELQKRPAGKQLPFDHL
jgi:probable DNA metabolism protein